MTMARLMSKDELMRHEYPLYAYLETRGGGKPYIARFTTTTDKQLGRAAAGYIGGICWYDWDMYNTSDYYGWRVWMGEPTARERKAAPWDDAQED